MASQERSAPLGFVFASPRCGKSEKRSSGSTIWPQTGRFCGRFTGLFTTFLRIRTAKNRNLRLRFGSNFMNKVCPIMGCSFGPQPTTAYPSRVISITIRLTNTETPKQGRVVWKKNGTSVGTYTQKALRRIILQCHFYAWWSFLLYATTKG